MRIALRGLGTLRSTLRSTKRRNACIERYEICVNGSPRSPSGARSCSTKGLARCDVRTNQYATDRSSRPVVNSLNESDPFSDRMKFFEELLGLLRDHRSPAPPELRPHQSRVAEPAEVHIKPGGLQHFRQVIGSAVRPPGSPGFACPFPLEVARPRTPQ